MSSDSIAFTKDDGDYDDLTIAFNINREFSDYEPGYCKVSRHPLSTEDQEKVKKLASRILFPFLPFENLSSYSYYMKKIVHQISLWAPQVPKDVYKIYVGFEPMDETRCEIRVGWQYTGITRLLLLDASDDDDDDEEHLCCICLEELASEVVCYLPCSHYFHDECIDEWIIDAMSCPLCRYPMPYTRKWFEG